jgi:hypothetical protein
MAKTEKSEPRYVKYHCESCNSDHTSNQPLTAAEHRNNCCQQPPADD